MYTFQKAIVHGGALTNYKRKRKWKITKRFYLVVGILLALALIVISLLIFDYTPILDKLIPKYFVTSPYMRAVFYE